MKLYNTVDKRVLKEKMAQSKEARVTLSFYKYAKIGNPEVFRDHMFYEWQQLGVFGRMYVANEGVNGQISVPEDRFDDFKRQMDSITFLEGVRLNIAIEDDGKSFYKLKIKVKEKIVADGLEDDTFDVTDRGKHLNAKEFNELTDQEDVVLIDMRNHYESEVGHFENAICPDVDTFRESLPLIVQQQFDNLDKPVVMYCTGGIRCEKASAYFKHRGFKNVFQLDGGIIEYTRQVREQKLRNKFKGKNFVFDERLGERIGQEIISQCHQCSAPCDRHNNCTNEACHLLFLQCDSCAAEYQGCCSETCSHYVALPEDMQKELRKGVYVNAHAYKKGRNSPFLENAELVAKVEEAYQKMMEQEG